MSIQSTRHPAPPASPARAPQPDRPRPALSRRALLAGTAAGAVGLSLAACGKSKKTDSKTVTVVTHDSFHVSEDLMKAFTSETGYTLKVAPSGDAGALVNKLVLTKDAPLGDAVFGIDNTYASRALDQGVIDTSATVTLPQDAEGYVVADTPALAPIDVGDVCLNIDTGYFTGKGLTPPATFEDLTKPEYKGLLVAINPTNSSPGMACWPPSATSAPAPSPTTGSSSSPTTSGSPRTGHPPTRPTSPAAARAPTPSSSPTPPRRPSRSPTTAPPAQPPPC